MWQYEAIHDINKYSLAYHRCQLSGEEPDLMCKSEEKDLIRDERYAELHGVESNKPIGPSMSSAIRIRF
jgi:hypothetical protein